MNQKKQIIIFGITTMVWTAVILAFSSQDGSASSEASGSILDWILQLGIPISEYILRKCAHVFIYFVLGVSSTLLGRSLLSQWEKWQCRGGMIFGVGYSIVCACVDEWNQYHIAGRSGQLSDVGVDAIGFVLGSVLLTFVLMRWMSRTSKL